MQHSFNNFFDCLIKDRSVTFREHWVWLYGCAGKFKSARSFYRLCCLHRKIKIKHTWSFFESGHGKEEHDGVGACIKQALRRYQMKFDANIMQDEKSVVDWCNQNLFHRCDAQIDKFICRFFWHIMNVDREHVHTCKTVTGTRSFHFVRSTDHTDWALHVRQHACYCGYCIGNEFQESCINLQQGFVEEWKQTILKSLDHVGPTQVHIPIEERGEDPQLSSDYDVICGLEQEGMKILIPL